jgi:hypothetical protein
MLRLPAALHCALLLGLAATPTAFGVPHPLAAGGKTAYVIVVDPGATPAERHAADELSSLLKQVTGAEFPVQATATLPAGPALLVGPGQAAAGLAPDLRLDTLDPDGLVIESRGPHLLLAGDRPRGTLYAVYTFLEDTVGCRWWSSKVSFIPALPELTIPEQHVRYVPPLEYREPFWFDAYDADFAVRNQSNGMATRLDEARGGKLSYAGIFVHTFDLLVPPGTHFKDHPEWFSEINGQRVGGGDGERTQLCVTNAELKGFLIQQVLQRLAENPEATIVSVSQNDWDNHCQCAPCKALEDAEGSPAGPLLHLVNAIATEVGKTYPQVAVDTLAYQYTRKPPRHVKPLPNVIVRLCSIECDFAHPLTAESNRTFADDIKGWSAICKRLYIWDYTTNFSHYIQPHPNLRVLGPNIRFFVANGVKGIFEQGGYQSPGGEFAELRAWVLAKLLWNPQRDDRALVDEFVRGYYGPAAPFIAEYIQRLHDEAEARNTYLNIGMTTSAGFLNLTLLSQAERLFNQAEAAAQADPQLLQRVQVARLPLRYVWLRRWYDLQDEAAQSQLAWPGPADYVGNLRTFLDLAKANGITMISEGSRVDSLERRTVGLKRTPSPRPPGCEGLPRGQYFDLQDAGFYLANEGVWAGLEPDDLASDKVAVRMPGDHNQWATQQPLAVKRFEPQATYSVYVAVRVEKTGNEGQAFGAGIYDDRARADLGAIAIPCAGVADAQYHVYKLNTTTLNENAFLWVAPTRNAANVKAVWVDRFWIVREK